MKYYVCFLLLFLFLNSHAESIKVETPKQVINNFYHRYLDFNIKLSKGTRPKLAFSKSFQILIDQNSEICKQNAGSDICGFGANGDEYLNSQEIDPKLTFKSSQFSASEIRPGEVEVHLNVYPSVKDKEGFYQRKILFKMIKEKDHWVVDDIFYSGISARKMIADENELFKKTRLKN